MEYRAPLYSRNASGLTFSAAPSALSAFFEPLPPKPLSRKVAPTYWILYLLGVQVLLDLRAHALLELGADRAARVLVELEGLLGVGLAYDDGGAVVARGVLRGDQRGVGGLVPLARLVGLHDRVADAAYQREDGDDGAGHQHLAAHLVLLGLLLALGTQPLAGRRLVRLAVA